MQLTDKEIEFLIALNAHEESFLYQIRADLAERLPCRAPPELVNAACVALESLWTAGIVRIGKRNPKYEEYEEGKLGSGRTFPDTLRDLAQWEWPDDSTDENLWYVFLTGEELPGRGLDAIPVEKRGALVFGPTPPPGAV